MKNLTKNTFSTMEACGKGGVMIRGEDRLVVLKYADA